MNKNLKQPKTVGGRHCRPNNLVMSFLRTMLFLAVMVIGTGSAWGDVSLGKVTIGSTITSNTSTEQNFGNNGVIAAAFISGTLEIKNPAGYYAKISDKGKIKIRVNKGSVFPGDILKVNVGPSGNDSENLGYLVEGSNTFVEAGKKTAPDKYTMGQDIAYTLKSRDIQNEDASYDFIQINRSGGGNAYAYHSVEILKVQRYSVSLSMKDATTGCDAWFTLGDDATEHRGTVNDIVAGTKVVFHGSDAGADHSLMNGWRKAGTSQNDGWLNWGATYTVNSLDANLNYEAEFWSAYRIFANAENGATAIVYTNTSTKDNISGRKQHDNITETLYFSTTVPDGYTFDGWYNGSTKVSSDNPWNYGKYTSQGGTTDLTLTAKFTPNNHTVTFSTNDAGMGTVTATVGGQTITSGSTVAHGTKVTFIATPTGTNVFHWWKNKPGVPATVNVTITEDVNYEAIFDAGIDFKAYAGLSSMGSVTIKQDDSNKGTSYHSAPYPQNLIYTATPNAGFSFVGWYTDEARTQAFKTKNGTAITASEINLTTLYDNDSESGISGDFRTNGLTLYAKFSANNALSKPKCNHAPESNGSNYFDITKLYTNLTITDFSQDGRTITVPTTGGSMSYFFNDEYDFGDLKSWTIGDIATLQDRISNVNFYDANGNLLADFWSDAGNRTSLDDASKKKLNKVKEIRIGFKGNSDKYPVTETLSYTFKWICFTFEHADRVKPVLSEGTSTDMRVFTGENLILANGSGFWRQYTDNTYSTIKSDGFIPTNEWVKRYVITADQLTKDEDYYFRVVDSSPCALGYQHSSEAVDVHVKVTDPINKVEVNGTTRQYDVYAPEGITSSEPSKVGVIFSLHGASNDYWNGRVDFNAIAEAKKNVDGKKFIVVYPRGLMRQLRGQERGWETYTESNTEDVEFFKAIVTELKKTYTVDDKRIYLAGFSNGGMMAYKAAHQAGDFFAAFASVGGFPVNESHLFHAGSQPTPFIHIQGAADAVFPSATYDLSTIAHNMTYRNGAHFNPYDTGHNFDGGVVPEHSNVTREIHVADEGGAAYFLYTIAGMGHTWSYNWDGKAGDDVATAIWNFFDYSGKVNNVDPTLKFRMHDPNELWSIASTGKSSQNAEVGYIGFDNVDTGTSVLSYGGRSKTDNGTTEFNKDSNNKNMWHSLQFNGGINGAPHFLKLNVETKVEKTNDFFLVKLTKTGDSKPVFAKRYQAGRGKKDLYINFAALPGFNEYKLEVTKSRSDLDVKVHGMEFYSGRCEDKEQEENPVFFTDIKTIVSDLQSIYQPVYGTTFDELAKEYLPIANIPIGEIEETHVATGTKRHYKVIEDNLKVNGTVLKETLGKLPSQWGATTTRTTVTGTGYKNLYVSNHSDEKDPSTRKVNNIAYILGSNEYTVDPVKGLNISQHGRAQMVEYLNGTVGNFPTKGMLAIKFEGTCDFTLLAENDIPYTDNFEKGRSTLKVYYTNDQLDGELKELEEWWFYGTRSEGVGNDNINQGQEGNETGNSLNDLRASIRLSQLGKDGTCTVFITYEGRGQHEGPFTHESDDNDKIWIKGFVIKRPDLKVTIGRTDSKYAEQKRGEEENTKLTRFGENKPYIWSFENVGFNNTRRRTVGGTLVDDTKETKVNVNDWRTYVCGGTDDSFDHLLVYSNVNSSSKDDKAQFDGSVAGQEHIEFRKPSDYTMKDPKTGRQEFNPITSNGLKVNVTGSGWFKIKCAAPNGPVNMKVYSSTNYGISYTNLLREFIVDNSKHPTSATGKEDHRWGEYTVYLKGHVERAWAADKDKKLDGFWDGDKNKFSEDNVANAEEKVRMSLYVVFDKIDDETYTKDGDGSTPATPQLNIHQLSWLNEEPADYVFQREEDPKLLTTWQAIRRDVDDNKTLDDSSDANVVLYWKAGNDDDANYTVLKGHANGSYNVINQVNTDDAAKGVKSPGSYASTSVPSDAGTYDAYWDIAAPARVNALVEKAYGDNAKKTDTQYAYSSGNNTEFDTPISGSFIRISAMKNTYVVAHVIPGNTSVDANATPHSGATVYVLDETGNPIPSSSSDANASRLGYIAAMVNGGSPQYGGVASQDKTIRIDFVANAGKEYFICANGASISLARLEVHNWRNWTHKPTKAETLALTDNADNSSNIETAYETGNYYRDATLKRTFAAGKWASLVLPFSLNEQKFKEVFGENAKCIHFTDVDTKNNVVKLTHHYYNMIVAGRPVFIYTPDEVVNPQFKDITLQTKVVKNTTTTSGFTFHASYDGTEMKWNDLYMNNANAIKYVSNDKSKHLTYPGMRSFIQSPNEYDPSEGRAGSAGAKAVFLSFLDDDYQDIPTGIEELISAELGEDVVVVTKTTKIYDLLGNVMGEGSDINSLPAGIYIVNGKKYIVK